MTALDDDTPATIGTYTTLLLQALRQLHRYRLHLEREKLRHRDTRQVLHVAVTMLGDKDRALDRERETSQRLRDEIRRYTAAKLVPTTTNDDTGAADTGQPSTPGEPAEAGL